jgi:O-antigen ligase
LVETGKRWRRAHAVVVVLACAAIVLSGTRSALLAIAAGGILFEWRRLHKGAEGLKLRLAGLAVVLPGLAAASIFIISPAGASLRNRMLQWRTETGGPRLQMWRESPALIGRHALIGIGPETFAVEFRKVQSAALSRAHPDFTTRLRTMLLSTPL